MPDRSIASSAAKLVVIGQGYVGLPFAMRAVEAATTSSGSRSIVARRAARGRRLIRRGRLSETSRGLPWRRVAITAERRYDDCTGFDVAVITVPTPLREGRPT